MRYLKGVLLLGLAGSFLVFAGEKQNLMVGVKIYECKGSLPELFAEWRSLGINTVFAGVPLASQKDFRELARKHRVSIFLILPIFYNPEELQKDPGLFAVTDRGEKAKEDWVEFVCPTREDYRKRRVDYIKTLIRELDPDGISLDFIRQFVFWEMIYPERTLDSIPSTCFDQSCLDKFQRDTGLKVPGEISGIPEWAEWIKKNHGQEWTEWKCGVITDMVKSIALEARKIKPEIMVNIHAVPWRENDFGGAIKAVAGQNLKALAPLTDLVSPMCYWHMLKRQPAWISSVVEDVYSQTRGRVVPSIQVSNAYLSDKLSLAEFREALEEALKPPSQGVVFWSWEAFEKEPEKKAAVRALGSSGK